MSAASQLKPGTQTANALAQIQDQVSCAVSKLQEWIEVRDYAGYEPYDILNAPVFSGTWWRRSWLSALLIQASRRWGGVRLRRILNVPESKNPKALGLMLSGYCDRLRLGEPCLAQARYLKSELARLRSPEERMFCWGYDWHFVSLRNTVLPAYHAHAIATVFCGQALLDLAEITGDSEAGRMAASAAEFLVTRLNRSVDVGDDLCFSYTPSDRTRVYNSSALVGAFLARIAAHDGRSEYLDLARRAMHYLVREQQADGSWYYGAARLQRWIDSFHTAYNLTALMEYRQWTGDRTFDRALHKGYDFYQRRFFEPDGAPKYLHDRTYPLDIHCCSQAILAFCAFSNECPEALGRAMDVTKWTLNNMAARDGWFYYQKHRCWTNRTPYMRWGQAWMFRALTHAQKVFQSATWSSDRPIFSSTHGD
jgi:hypothetical protein